MLDELDTEMYWKLILYFSGLNIVLIIVAALLMVYQFKRKFPEKSYVIAVIDTLMFPLRKLRLGPFKKGEWTYEKQMELAVEQTGLKDFGDRSFIESYKSLHSGRIYKRLRYTNLGQFIMQSEFEMLMGRRLRAVAYLKKNPEISKIEIKSPVFVFGLGRSGTTFTHHLLSMDPNVRSPTLWELLYPVPEFTESDKNLDPERFKTLHRVDREARAQRLRERLKVRLVLGQDGMENIHEVGADLPEECLHVMSDEIPVGANHVFNALNDWELFLSHSQKAGDALRAYKWYKQILQILMHQLGDSANPRRWVLKSPIHILFLKELKEVFPDAKLVWAHRHPAPTITSLCTLTKALHGMYFDKDTLHPLEHGQNLYKLAKMILPRVTQDLAETGLPCAHVRYQDLVVDPVGTSRKVYEHFGWEFSAEYGSVLQTFLKDNAARRAKIAAAKGIKGSEPLNLYHPAEYGLRAEQLSEGVFKDYADRYELTSSK